LQTEVAPWRKRIRRAVLLVCAALPGMALAQVVFEPEDIPAEEVEEIRIYLVEMIVFEHAAGALSGTETFLPEEQPQEFPVVLPQLQPGKWPEIAPIGPVATPYFGDPEAIFDPPPPAAIDTAIFTAEETPEYLRWLEQQPLVELPSHILQTRLQVLDAEQHAMPEIYRKLRALGAYKPLVRAAWTQAVYEKDRTLPLDLRRLGDPPLRLEGVLTLYLSRYLHLVVDLAIDAGDTVLPDRREESSRYYGDNRTGNYFDEDYKIATAPVRYRIFEDRIFRNGEIRYYDHPKFGVLARISRVEEPEEDPDGEQETGAALLFPAT